MLDIDKIRKSFPALQLKVQDHPLVYLDNSATSQTPDVVVNEIVDSYTLRKANVHRGVHTLSQEATARQEACRKRVCEYLNADSVEEIIFTRGTT
ncbi:MAG: aminotransferase class V-fold PLP-dependent enzyme, partial [Muribaculaceae bacterium]|nr:aminotransferase class V-fold PLP-dependent enzyme [Muribaculaceae bacterium]